MVNCATQLNIMTNRDTSLNSLITFTIKSTALDIDMYVTLQHHKIIIVQDFRGLNVQNKCAITHQTKT